MSKSFETRLSDAQLPYINRNHSFVEAPAGVGGHPGLQNRTVSKVRSQKQKRQTEHLSLEGFLNPHGVTVYPALRTQSELARGRRHEPVPRMTQDAQGQWVRKDSLAPGEVYRYSQDTQGQWKRGLENLRTLALDSGMPLALIPEPRGKIYRDSDGTVSRERAPMVSRKMVLNEAGDWERAAA